MITKDHEFLALFKEQPVCKDGVYSIPEVEMEINQQQTRDAFSEKWVRVRNEYDSQIEDSYDVGRKWYLQLYGFEDEAAFRDFLSDKKVILDAGCGLGYKAAWMAQLNPDAMVLGMDISDAINEAAKHYGDIPNLFFVRGDISDTGIKEGAVDYVSCDQVIHHTEDPEATFRHLASLVQDDGEFACYVYAKKSLPRELLDEYFRTAVKDYGPEQIWELSEQLTHLGKTLTDLNLEIDVPDMPLLGIKGGKQDLQRFIYWNFIKCFWNPDMGFDQSKGVNFDWYAPSNAYRYSEDEFRKWIRDNNLKIEYFHKEEACYSGRFKK